MMAHQPASTEKILAQRDSVVEAAAAHFAAGDSARGIAALRGLQWLTIDDQTLDRTDGFLPVMADGRTIVATTDAGRRPADGEVVIIYGNYPHTFDNVVVNNPMRRHVADFGKFRHDTVESDPRWGAVDRIFVINLDRRRDRLDGVMRELAMARAPLDKVIRAAARVATGASQAEGQIACLGSHIDVLRRARDLDCGQVLVLEDDFCFTTDVELHLANLDAFAKRQYDYWICLIATSKYGDIVPVDDLVAMSFQRCTNTGGYLASRAGVAQLLPVYEAALERLIATGDCITNAVDRCWSVLQPSGRFLVFQRKFGFQVSSYSDIEHTVSRYLD